MGYLSSHLSLTSDLNVIGIDSSESNRKYADIRGTRLQKHWKGLVRNATEEANGSMEKVGRRKRAKARRAQEKVALQLTTGENSSELDSATGLHVNIKRSPPYTSLTGYITSQTDLLDVVNKHGVLNNDDRYVK